VTPEMFITLGILTFAILFFVTEWLRVDVVAIIVVVALMLTGVLETKEALAGFSNAAVIAITALFVVGGAIMHTGLAGQIGRRILRIAGTSQLRLMVVVMLSVAFLSGFMSSTGTVAVLLPAIISLSQSAKISPAKLLIPLSFGSLLGGATTLIGTPPNIIVSNILRDHDLEPFHFFDYTPIGVILLVVGILYMLLVGKRLLPDHKTKQDVAKFDPPDELLESYRVSDDIFRLRVRRASSLVGETIYSSGIRPQFDVNILEISRPAKPRSVVKLGDQSLVLQSKKRSIIKPDADTRFVVDDVLVVQINEKDLGHFAAVFNLAIQPTEDSKNGSSNGLVSNAIGIAEVLLPPRSMMLGKNLVETRFGSARKLTVLGIRRRGVDERLDLRETALQFGDAILVQGKWKDILALKQQRNDFIVLGQPEAMLESAPKSKAYVTLFILLAMMAMMIANVASLAAISLLAALALVLTKCLTMDDAYGSVDWKSIVLIACMLPMATALSKVGLVALAATWLTDTVGAYGPTALLVSMFFLTAVFTQVLSNTATTVLVAPIAISSAEQLGIAPYGILMAVAMAASMAFASPVASPTNTLVLSAGGYSFGDFLKVGLPLTIVMLVVSVIAIPLIWPF
jgi:di/tricarboxylate transporter